MSLYTPACMFMYAYTLLFAARTTTAAGGAWHPPPNTTTFERALMAVKWEVQSKKLWEKHPRSSWKEARLKHFGGNASRLVAGKSILLLGNSMVRITTNTLHRMLTRGASSPAILDVEQTQHIPDEQKPWSLHGAGENVYHWPNSGGGGGSGGGGAPNVRPRCSAPFKGAMTFTKCGHFFCCVTGTGGGSSSDADGTLAHLSYAFSGTPSEPFMLSNLKTLGDSRYHNSSCGVYTPDLIILQLSSADRNSTQVILCFALSPRAPSHLRPRPRPLLTPRPHAPFCRK